MEYGLYLFRKNPQKPKEPKAKYSARIQKLSDEAKDYFIDEERKLVQDELVKKNPRPILDMKDDIFWLSDKLLSDMYAVGDLVNDLVMSAGEEEEAGVKTRS